MKTSYQADICGRPVGPKDIDDLVARRVEAGIPLTPQEQIEYAKFDADPDSVDLSLVYLVLGGAQAFFEARERYRPRRTLGPKCDPYDD